MKKIITLFFSLISLNVVLSQNAGTYDVTFSGDGKETYKPNPASSPFVFLYNNEYITFMSSLFDVQGNSPIYQIEMIKHDLTGTFISKAIVLSDSAKPLTNMKDYYLTAAKQTSNGKFILASTDSESDNSPNPIGGTAYKGVLRVVDASGVIDASFGTMGKKELITDTIFNITQQEYKTIEVAVYSNNLIFASHEAPNASGYARSKIYKIDASGVTTNTAIAGSGSYDYYIRDVNVVTTGTVNSFYISGVTNYGAGAFYQNFVFKLTNGFNYDVNFNATSSTPGKLYINKGNAMQAASGGVFPYAMSSAVNATHLFTYILTEDSVTGSNNNVYVQQYTSAGVFLFEKEISDPSFLLYRINGIAIDNTGKVVALSTQEDTVNHNNKAYIVRLNPNTLAYDNSFNSNGRKTISFVTNGDNYASSFLVQADDKIVVACESVKVTPTGSGSDSNLYTSLARINGATPTGLADNTQTNSQIIIYPNPASGFIKLNTTTSSENNFNVEVYTIDGHLLKLVVANNNDEISTSDLSSGLYIVKILTTENILLTIQKLVIRN